MCKSWVMNAFLGGLLFSGIAGCKLGSVAQPVRVAAGTSFTAEVSISDAGRSDYSYGIACVQAPELWDVLSVSYVATAHGIYGDEVLPADRSGSGTYDPDYSREMDELHPYAHNVDYRWHCYVSGDLALSHFNSVSGAVSFAIAVPEGGTGVYALRYSGGAVGVQPDYVIGQFHYVTVVVDPDQEEIVLEPPSWNFGLAYFFGTEERNFLLTNRTEGEVVVGSIGIHEPPFDPFHLVADGCSGAILPPSESCSFTVNFVRESYSDHHEFLIVPIEEGWDEVVVLELRGSTGSVGTLRPQYVHFVGVDPDLPGIEHPFRVFNNVLTGDQDVPPPMLIHSIGMSDPLLPPFFVAEDSCSGMTLPALESCIFVIGVSPGAHGLVSDTFEISSTNPHGDISVSVDATGQENPGGISLGVSTFELNFGEVPVGQFSEEQTLRVMKHKYDGIRVTFPDPMYESADGYPFVPGKRGAFEIIDSDCQTVDLNWESCDVVFKFVPTVPGEHGATFVIVGSILDNREQWRFQVGLFGRGVESPLNPPQNYAPDAFVLLAPEDGALDIKVPVELTWTETSDPDGDRISYDVFVCEDASFAGCSPVASVGPVAVTSAEVPLWRGGPGLVLAGFVLAGGLGARKKRTAWLAFFLVTAGFLSSCGGGGNSSGTLQGQRSYRVSALKANTTYFWKIGAKDGNGGYTESETRSFSTSQP